MGALKVALIGLGGVGRVHLEAYRTRRDIKVVAAADLNPACRAIADDAGIRSYARYDEMLAAEAIDLACVLTPASTHEQIVVDCARAGAHVLCEKPLALSLPAGRRMLRECQANGVKLFYGASYRHLPAVRAARDLVASGAIGDVVMMREQVVGGRGRQHQQVLGEIHYPLGGPGGSAMGLIDHGVHLIDTFRWISGSEIVSVFGKGNISGQPLSTEYMLMTFANGATGHLLYDDGTYPTDLPAEGMFSWGAGWDADGYVPAGRWQRQPGAIHVHGSRGALRIMHYANALFLFTDEGATQVAVSDAAAPLHFAEQLASAARCIHQPSADSGCEDGLIALAALLAVYRSQETGALVSVELNGTDERLAAEQVG